MSTSLLNVTGYREAVERERTIREESFLIDAPEFICGVEVRPLTLLHLSRLTAVRSPFVCGGAPDAGQIGLFLWLVSPEYGVAIVLQNALRRLSPWLGRLVMRSMRYRFVAKLRRLEPLKAIAAINKYVDDALMDAPKGTSRNRISHWSMQAGAVMMVATQTGWSERDILQLPLKRLYQYAKMAEKIRNPEAILNNPSNDVWNQWLIERNRGRKN